MKIFGEKQHFAIEYGFESDEFEKGEPDSTYGSIRLWINGKDICSYRADGEDYQQEGNLYHLIEWFCEKMEYILGYDPFPLPVEGENTLELLENADKRYDTIDTLEEELWFEAKSRWIFNHCWFPVRDGILPCVHFRRLENAVEISWDNLFWEEYDIAFHSGKGGYLAALQDFTEIYRKFLLSAVSELEQRLGECKSSIKRVRDWL